MPFEEARELPTELCTKPPFDETVEAAEPDWTGIASVRDTRGEIGVVAKNGASWRAWSAHGLLLGVYPDRAAAIAAVLTAEAAS